jgi:hypothetical protein
MKHGRPPEIPANSQVFDGEFNREFYSKKKLCMSAVLLLYITFIHPNFLSEIKKVFISFLCKEDDIYEALYH